MGTGAPKPLQARRPEKRSATSGIGSTKARWTGSRSEAEAKQKRSRSEAEAKQKRSRSEAEAKQKRSRSEAEAKHRAREEGSTEEEDGTYYMP